MKKIYGIGTGPGDPELLTLKAVRVMKEADYIFAPNNRGKNMALDTCKEFIEGKNITLLDFPMGESTEEHYKSALSKIYKTMKDGEVSVFLNIGDSTIYSTFMNMIYFNNFDDVDIEIVPGIPSFVSAANEIKENIVIKGEKFLLCDSFNGFNLDELDSIAILKTSNNLEYILDTLEKNDFRYYYVKSSSLPDQKILTDREEILKEKNYISLILARRN